MKFRRRAGGAAREEVYINLASFIDVIFVLLLFFVVTATFSRPSQLKIELPEADSAAAAANQGKTLEISITADGQMALNGQTLVRNDLTGLTTALQRESGGDNSLPLVITADGRATHQSVVMAMDAAGKLGFSQLRITTLEAQAKRP
ncbi:MULTISPECIES: ExbD/TolR family protein [Pseudomonas]|uniref:ExbD/TolR family protein n=1 Tax=Pseudomonas TaxID=286 RepID=UPI000743F761|nr:MULTISPECIES: biopolymer transporter ExbD [Pseudomonas]KUM34080.1 biopolymer transporter ExbD [Pseudomonas sp. EpS/L25]MDT3721790.1 biopolymer transporter ExbD [Pseudomonas oryzihabitans]